MLFPETERVIYENNPLKNVICQLRFPVILRIGEGMPVEFQEMLRHEFPLFEEVNDESDLTLPESIAHFVPKELVDSLTSFGNRRFQLMTKDENSIISLTKDFIALETKRYRHWEEFRKYMELALTAFVEVYSPAFFTRIGLRYRNIIDRGSLGLESAAWHELLSSFVLGPLTEEEAFSSVVENHGVFSIRLNDQGDFVRVQHGLGTEKNSSSAEEMYLLDNDFYTELETATEVHNVLGILDRYNAFNRRLFYWCIQERLHVAMVPKMP